MAKKPRGFGEILKQQQQQKDQQKLLEKFQRKVQQGLLGDRIAGIVTNPKDQEKMSEVLEAFVEPYLDFVSNHEQRQKLFAIATLAWNLALLPEKEHKSEINKIIQQLCTGQGHQAKQDTREILEELMARKQEFFTNNKRHILDYQLQNFGQKFHLSVVSTLMEQPTSSQ